MWDKIRPDIGKLTRAWLMALNRVAVSVYCNCWRHRKSYTIAQWQYRPSRALRWPLDSWKRPTLSATISIEVSGHLYNRYCHTIPCFDRLLSCDSQIPRPNRIQTRYARIKMSLPLATPSALLSSSPRNSWASNRKQKQVIHLFSLKRSNDPWLK